MTGKEEHPQKGRYTRWFFKGLWIMPFSVIVMIGVTVMSYTLYGANSLVFQRSKIAAAVTVLISVITIVLAIFGGGWAQEEADKRVKG